MSSDMRKQDYCLCENKGADQLWRNCTADQPLCFRFMDSTGNFKLLAFFRDCTGWFVLDLVGTPTFCSSYRVVHENAGFCSY